MYRIRRLSFVLVFMISLLGSVFAVQAATETLDQEHAPLPGGGIHISPDQSVAQTFEAGLTGELTRISLSLSYEVGGADLTVEIRALDASGAPTGDHTPGTGTVLSSATVPASNEDYAEEWVDVVFPAPAQVISGTKYSIVLMADQESTGLQYVLGVTWNTNVYTSGSLWHCVTDSSLEDSCAYEETTSFGGGDALFRTYVSICNVASAIENLSDDIEAMGLPNGITTSLTAKLHDVSGDCHEGNEDASCGALNALANEVAALTGKKLTNEEAAHIETSVAALQAEIGCR